MMKINSKADHNTSDVSHILLSERAKFSDNELTVLRRKTSVVTYDSLEDANHRVIELSSEREHLIDQIESLRQQLNAPPF